MNALLVRIDDLQTRAASEHVYLRSPVRIGRNTLNDLVIGGGFVSQWHAVVQFNETAAAYYDLGSTNGTLVNGHRVNKNAPVPIDPRYEFLVGSVRLMFSVGPVPPHLAHQAAASGAPTGGMRGAGAPGQASLDSTVVYDPDGEPTQANVDGLGVASVLVRLRVATEELRPLYDNYRKAWQALYQGVARTVDAQPATAQAMAIGFLQHELPAICSEEQVLALARACGAPAVDPAAVSRGSFELLGQFAQYVAPSRGAPTRLADVQALLVRTTNVLEAFTQAYVALRRGQDEFGSQMAVAQLRGPNSSTPLTTARDPRQVLDYVMDGSPAGQTRVSELTSSYADVMIHQVALLHGLMEGVRGLLQRLAPATIERELGRTGGVFARIWPFRAMALWRQYVRRHLEFTEEDREISSAVFGAEFARAYAGAVGESYADVAAVSPGPGPPSQLPPGTVPPPRR